MRRINLRVIFMGSICQEDAFLGNRVTDRASKILSQTEGGSGTAARTIVFEDAALVERSQKGDMQAFGALVAKYQNRIFNAICRLCGNRSDVEELAQESFLRALERIGQFRGQSGFYTWLFRIATNLAISHRRRLGRVRFHSMTARDDFDGNQAEALTAAMARKRAPNPQAAAISADVDKQVIQALETLDEEFRLVVVLRDVEDMDYGQIADVLNVPVGTVKSRLHRGRCILREKLADLVN